MTSPAMAEITKPAASRSSSPRAVRIQSALQDLMAGIRRHELWIFLGWRDVQKHYRRSTLGPFWLTLSMGIMIASLGVLYSQILNVSITEYMPFLTVGFVVWTLIGNSLTGACTVFISAAGPLRQISLPFSVYVYQFVWSQLISFGHNFIIYLLVIVLFAINPGWTALLFLPALLLITLDIVFCTMILGTLCLRFRDIPMIVASIIQVAFFMTPILWSADLLPQRSHFLALNPFYHFMQIAREPLLGKLPGLLNWGICLGITAMLAVVAFLFFGRFRSRIPYWA